MPLLSRRNHDHTFANQRVLFFFSALRQRIVWYLWKAIAGMDMLRLPNEVEQLYLSPRWRYSQKGTRMVYTVLLHVGNSHHPPAPKIQT